MGKANAVFGRLLRTIFHKPHISRITKARIYCASVTRVVLYSSETWPLTQSQMMKVDSAQKKHRHKIELIRWLDKVRKKDILRSFKLPPLFQQLESRSLHWYGHLFCLPIATPTRLIFNFDPTLNGWKRPRQTDILFNRLRAWSIDSSEAPTRAQNRPLWRRQTALTSGSLYEGVTPK